MGKIFILMMAILFVIATAVIDEHGKRPEAMAQSSICLLADGGFGAAPVYPQVVEKLYTINTTTGAATLSATTQVSSLIGIAWGSDSQLYGVTTASPPAGGQGNSLYRIDTTTGATTLIGSIALGNSVFEGDLATQPGTGKLFGINSINGVLFSLNSFPSPVATVIGTVVYPSPGSGWDISAMAFDANGTLYAVTRKNVDFGGQSVLLTINPATAAVITAVALSQNVHGWGGMQLLGGTLYYADGGDPDMANPVTNSFLKINTTTGAVTTVGSTGIPGGMSGLTGCNPPQAPGCVTPPPDLDAWYPFDGNANERILGLNAATNGAVTYGPGEVGNAAVLAGGYFSVANTPVLNEGMGDFSLDAWVYFPPSWFPATATVRTLIDKRTGTPLPHGYALFLYHNYPGLQLADSGSGGGYSNYTSPSLQVATPGWHHLAVTVRRGDTHGLQFYVDGVPAMGLDPTGRQGNLDNASPVYFGRNVLNGSVSTGVKFDEIEFFDRALTAAEIFGGYKAGPAGKCKV